MIYTRIYLKLIMR